MIDLWTLLLPLRTIKSRVSVIFKYGCDLAMKKFGYIIFLSGVEIVILLYFIGSGWFEGQKGIVSILQSGG